MQFIMKMCNKNKGIGFETNNMFTHCNVYSVISYIIFIWGFFMLS